MRIAGYRDEIVSVQEQEALVRDELEGIQSLAAKKLVSLARVRALERTIAELEGRHAALRTTIATAG